VRRAGAAGRHRITAEDDRTVLWPAQNSAARVVIARQVEPKWFCFEASKLNDNLVASRPAGTASVGARKNIEARALAFHTHREQKGACFFAIFIAHVAWQSRLRFL